MVYALTFAAKERTRIRQEVLDYIGASSKPLFIYQVARVLGIPLPTVRGHVTALVNEGKLVQKYVKDSEDGRLRYIIGTPESLRKISPVQKTRKSYRRSGSEDAFSEGEAEDGLKNLMVQILKQARQVLLQADPKYRSYLMKWFLSTEDEYIFGCAAICQYLGVNQEALIQRLRGELKEKEK